MKFDPNLVKSGVSISDRTLSADGIDFTSGTPERRYSGKWYFEVKCNAVTAGRNGDGVVGITEAINTIAKSASTAALNAGYGISVQTDNVFTLSTATTPYGTNTYTVGDVYGVAVDLDNGKIYYAINNTWLGSSNPATSTSPASTGITSTKGYYPIVLAGPTTNENLTLAFNTADLAYSPPSGYSAWGSRARTLAPNGKSTSATLSNGNRTIASTHASNYGGAYCDEGIYLRKVYFEAKFDSPGAAGRTSVGIGRIGEYEDAVASFTPFNSSGGSTDDRIHVSDEGKVYERNNLVFTGTAFAPSDTCMFAFDPNTGKVWVGRNGTWFNSGDPAAGTGAVYTVATTSDFGYHAGCVANGFNSWQVTVNFGSVAPTYDVPFGFTMMGANYGSFDAAVAVAAPMSFLRKAFRTLAASIGIAAAFARSRITGRSFDAAVGIATAFTRRRVLTATLPASVTATTAMNKRAILHALLTGQAVVLTDLDFEGGTYIGWVANADIGAHSMYTDFDFNSLAADGENYYGAKSDGLYLLGADDDAGAEISARVRTGRDSMGLEQQKRVPAVYLGVKGEGDLMLKVVMDERTAVYDLHIRNPQMAESRVKPGKGYKSVFWQFELVNRNGADFEQKDMTVFPIILQRRIK